MNSFSVRHWIHNLCFVLAVVVCKASAAAPRRGGCCYSWPLSMYRIQLYLTWHVIYDHLVAQGKKELLNGYWAWDRGNNRFVMFMTRFGGVKHHPQALEMMVINAFWWCLSLSCRLNKTDLCFEVHWQPFARGSDGIFLAQHLMANLRQYGKTARCCWWTNFGEH